MTLLLCALTAASGAWAAPDDGDETVEDTGDPPEDPGADGASETDWFAGARGTAVQVLVGPGYRRWFGVGMMGVDVDLGVGSQTRLGGVYGRLRVEEGRTKEGLRTGGEGLGFSWEAPLGPVRMGVNPQIMAHHMVRATSSERQWDMTFSAYGFVYVAVAETRKVDFVVGAKSGVSTRFGVEPGVQFAGAAVHVGATFHQSDASEAR